MTAEEKARELIQKFSKDQIMIMIEGILQFSQDLGTKMYQEIGTDSYESRCANADMAGYWREVKKRVVEITLD